MELMIYFLIGFTAGAYAQHKTMWLDRFSQWLADNL